MSWKHVPLTDVIEDTGVELTKRGDDEDGPKYVGAHTTKHGSSSGTSLVVWVESSNWWCSSCKASGNVVDWLVDAGAIGDDSIETKQDAIDYLIEKYGLPPDEWTEPEPFPEAHGPEFPMSVLPPVLRRFVEEGSQALQVRKDILACDCMSTVSAAATRKARVRIRPGWEEPLNTWIVVVAESGEGKSPSQETATPPLEELASELAEESRTEIARAQTEQDLLESQLAAAKKAASKLDIPDEDRDARRDLAFELAERLTEHTTPAAPQLLCENVTPEALGTLLAEQGGVMALFSDEGDTFEIMAGLYSDGKVSIDVFVKSFTGTGKLRVNRASRPAVFVDRPRLTLSVSVQPGVLRKLTKRPDLRDKGLLARPAYVVPRGIVGYRDTDPPPVSVEAGRDYHRAIKAIACMSDETDAEPHILTLSPEAKSLLDAFHTHLERRLRPGEDLHGIRDWASKLRSQVPRFAGNFHMTIHWDMKEPWKERVSGPTMAAAIKLGEYLIEHALVAFDLMGAAGKLVVPSELWETISRRGGHRFTQRDLHQAVKHRYEVKEVSDGLRVLDDMGYVREQYVPGPGNLGGRRRSPTYEVNPLAEPAKPQPDGGFEGSESSELKESEKTEPTIEVAVETAHEDRPPAQETPQHECKQEDSQPASYAQNPQNPQNRPREADFEYISDPDRASEVVSILAAEQAVGLDIETTGLDAVLDKIRLVQLSTPRTTYVVDLYRVPLDALVPVLDGGPVKVVHNAKFDSGFLYEAPRGVMPEPVFDTMLADQVIHHRSYGRSLKDLATEYLDIDLDKEQRDSDWEAEQLSRQQIVYAARDAAVLLPLRDKLMSKVEQLQLTRVVDLENSLVPAMCWMERSGVGFDRDKWNTLVAAAADRAEGVKRELNEIVSAELGADGLWGRQPHDVNWDSTAQVLQALQDLGLDIDNTRQETLEAAKAQHSIIPMLLAYREAAKKLSTYGTKWSKHVHPATNRVHADWRQIGAATGRMACRKPNLQNLPREAGYRACFRASPGRVLIKADYAQIELRIAAEMAQDARMMQAFQAGEDLHVATARLVNGRHANDEVTLEDRQLAKAVNFGLIYGMGARTLASYARTSFGVQMDERAASAVRARYFEAYSGISRWHRTQGLQKETRTVLGRRRTFDGDGHFTKKLNSPVQGTGADGLKLALIALWETRGDVDAYPVLVAHDEIVVEAPSEQAEEARDWLVRCMKVGMSEVLKEVPVVVDVEVKESWG